MDGTAQYKQGIIQILQNWCHYGHFVLDWPIIPTSEINHLEHL